MSGRGSRIAKLFSLPVLAVCGFLVAAMFAGVGLGVGTTGSTTETTTTTGGGEGCTPGYWKTDQHLDSWVATGFSPNQTLESVFDVPDSLGIDTITLRQALGPPTPGALNGGGVNALLRHAVAALLNAAHPDVDNGLTAASVIADTNAALASGDYEDQKNIFAALNEQDCPLD